MRGTMAGLMVAMVCGCVWAQEGKEGKEGKDGGDPFLTHGAEKVSDEAVRARAECARMLQSLRGQVELYKLQHEDRYPTKSGRPVGEQWQWELLTGKTKDAVGREIGPYLQQALVNPVAKSSKVAGKPEAGAGWMLEENGRMHALDETGNLLPFTDQGRRMPNFGQASMEARVSSARSMQQTMAAQLELYKLQHEDRYPTTSGKPVAAEWSWDLLTKVTTNAAGQKVGPYLANVPTNPLTNSNRVVAKPEKGAGWVLTEEGRFKAVTAEGKVLE